MAIRMMCNEDHPGAVRDDHWSRETGKDIFLVESHKGLVISTGEVNGYNDSDFFAIVWNAEKGTCERIEYASTRGWTYPNSATVDATPEVLAAYKAFCDQQDEAARARARAREAATPKVGRRVRITKAVTRSKDGKNNCAIGEEGELVFVGADDFNRVGRYMTPMQRALHATWKDPREGLRIGVKLEGRRVYINAMNAEVLTG
jgi:hypothetical protein